MAIDEFKVSAQAEQVIRDAGYKLYYGMDEHIAMWWQWYTAATDFYKVEYTAKDGEKSKKKSRDRFTLKPAKKVCREYASLILTEDTEISVEDAAANEWLQDYLERNNFWPNGQNLIEKAFAQGTAGWFMWVNVDDETTLELQRRDARMIKPLSFSEEGITECAVASRITIKGESVEQLQLYILDGGTYHIKTHLFKDGQELSPETYGYISDFDTESRYKPFGIVRPAIENTVADLSPYGMSIFADAISHIKAVDLAFDSMFQEVDLTGVKVFMDESLIDTYTADGRTIPVSDSEQRAYRMVDGQGSNKLIDVFSPAIRTDPLFQALNVALAELGDECGFGEQYFKLDKTGGLKTATEVVSDNGVLMRNVRKHENAVRGAIQDVMSALLDNARIHCGAPIAESFGAVSVKFDDSIITDTQTEKNQMLAEIAAGVRPKWHYLVAFDGKTEDEAKALLPQETVIDTGL